MNELIAWVQDNAVAIFAAITAVHAAALAIVNLTPTPKDNEFLATVYKPIEFIAGIITKKAKDPGAPPTGGQSSSRVGPLSCIALVLLAGVMLCGQVGCQNVGNRFEQDVKRIASETNAANRAGWTDENGVIVAEGGVGASTVTKITDGEIVQSKGGTSNRTVVMSKKPDGNVQLALSSDTDIAAESLSFDNSTGNFEVRGFSTTVSEPQRALNEGLANVQAYWVSLSADQREARIADLKAIEAAGGQLGEFAGKLLQALVTP